MVLTSICSNTRSATERGRSMYIKAEHIQEIVNSGQGAVLSEAVSRAFGDFVESLPRLAPSGVLIDWCQVPNSRSVEWYAISDEEFVQWARGMAIGQHSAVVAWYNSNEPCLLCDFEFGVANADVLFWLAPGTRYLFGTDRHGAMYNFHYAHFLEFGGGSRVTGVATE